MTSPWQVTGLCFHSWDSRFQMYRMPSEVQAKGAATKGIAKNALALSVVVCHFAAFDCSTVPTEVLTSSTAALSSGIASFGPQLSARGLHSLLDFRTGHVELLKGERVLLIAPCLSNSFISSWTGIRKSQLVQYCHQCTVVIMIGICYSSTLSKPTREGSSERLGNVDNSSVSSACAKDSGPLGQSRWGVYANIPN